MKRFFVHAEGVLRSFAALCMQQQQQTAAQLISARTPQESNSLPNLGAEELLLLT